MREERINSLLNWKQMCVLRLSRILVLLIRFMCSGIIPGALLRSGFSVVSMLKSASK